VNTTAKQTENAMCCFMYMILMGYGVGDSFENILCEIESNVEVDP
jgi:hypothetical protein